MSTMVLTGRNECKRQFNREVFEQAIEAVGPDLARLLWEMAFAGRSAVKRDDLGEYVTGFHPASHFAERLGVSVFTIRRWWKRLIAAGLLEQWRIVRGLAYRVRLLAAASNDEAGNRSEAKESEAKRNEAPAAPAPPGAHSALSARSPDKKAKPKSQKTKTGEEAREAWRARVLARPDTAVNRFEILTAWGVRPWMARRLAASGIPLRVMVEVAEGVMNVRHRLRSLAGVIVHRLKALLREHESEYLAAAAIDDRKVSRAYRDARKDLDAR